MQRGLGEPHAPVGVHAVSEPAPPRPGRGLPGSTQPAEPPPLLTQGAVHVRASQRWVRCPSC